MTILIFLIIALPDELLCVVFKYFSLKEIINKLRLVCRRWRRISESDMLWTNVCLDEWGITHLSEDQLKTIIQHARGFINFSVAYIDVKKRRVKETQSIAHAICNSLCLSRGLNYLNLSGQLVSNLTFLQGTCQLEYLILNDCIALKDVFPISFCKNLTFLSLNRVVIHEGELLQSVLPLSNLFFIAVKGNELSLESLKEMCKTLCKVSVLNLDFNTVNRSEFLSLASEFDINVNNAQIKGAVR